MPRRDSGGIRRLLSAQATPDPKPQSLAERLPSPDKFLPFALLGGMALGCARLTQHL